MRNILIILTFIVHLNSAMITGGQDKISISGGSMNVTSSGVTQVVNSGQITFIKEGKAPTKARKVKPSDLKDITDGLKMSNLARPINLKFDPTKSMVAKKIGRFLVKAGVPRSSLEFNKENELLSLYVKQIDINLIKNIYPSYYKAVSKYYQKYKKRLSKKKNVPTIIVKLNMIKKYHKTIYRKYNK